jgi:hypothetical protein
MEVIKRTLLPNDVVVVTTRRTNPYLTRPFATFAISPTTRYALRFTDFVTESAALNAHASLAWKLQAKGTASDATCFAICCC